MNSVDSLIDNYIQRWNIEHDKDYVGVGKRNTHISWDDRKEGEIWKEDNKWYKKEDGVIISSFSEPSPTETLYNVIEEDRCTECKKFVINKNERKVLHSHGLCYSCRAKKELEDISSKKDFKKSDNVIIIKNSFGRPIMTIDDYRKEYGDEEADKFIQDYNQLLETKNKHVT